MGAGFDRGQANATVFAASSTVLGIDAELLRQPGGTHPSFEEAKSLIASCRLDPVDRLAWVTRLGTLGKQIAAHGEGELAGLLRVLTETLSNC